MCLSCLEKKYIQILGRQLAVPVTELERRHLLDLKNRRILMFLE